MAKRISQTAINWGSLAERVPTEQRPIFMAFKAKHDSYMRRVLQYPDKPPALDWNMYKAKIPVAGMVDNFQKQYEALTIPYPPNPVTSQLDALEKDVKQNILEFKKESQVRIDGFKKELAHLASLIPYDQMTMEDYRDAYPDTAHDPLNRPTFWPHQPEDQLDYKDKEDHSAAH